MNDKRALAPWIKRFLLEYLPTDRNFARNTQHSYRDALRLFVIFSSAVLRTKPDELLVSRPGDFVSTNPLLRIGVSPAERFC